MQIYDYTANKGKPSYKKPLFKIQKEQGNELTHPDDMFKESLYEHDDSVTCVEKNFKDNCLFATASKDSSVCLWKFTEGKDKVEFLSDVGPDQFKHGSNLHTGGITATKWYEENVLVMSLSNGTVQLKDIREKESHKCMLLAQSDSAIWDM